MPKFAPVNRWTPEGELRVFDHIDEVPEGWLSKHPEDPNHVAATAPKDEARPGVIVPMERDEIIEALHGGGFEFKKNAPTRALYQQLREHAKAHLTAAGTPFDPEDDARTLLGLVSPEA